MAWRLLNSKAAFFSFLGNGNLVNVLTFFLDEDEDQVLNLSRKPVKEENLEKVQMLPVRIKGCKILVFKFEKVLIYIFDKVSVMRRINYLDFCTIATALTMRHSGQGAKK